MGMKLYNCNLHGVNFRPDVCNDCAQAILVYHNKRHPKLRVEEQDRNRLKICFETGFHNRSCVVRRVR